ncbi:MAG: proton-conducting transporter membrane subunit [Candidatus Nezhaarchaeales archaeon]
MAIEVDIVTALKPIIALMVFSALTPIVGYIEGKAGFKYSSGIFATLGFLIALVLSIDMYGLLPAEGIVSSFPGFGPPLGVEVKVDALSMFMVLLFSALGLLVSIYSIKYMEHDTGLDRYYTLLLLLVAGMIGVAVAGDFFTLFVFWELMSISSYSLVSFRKYRWEPIEAGFKYLVMSTFGSLIALLGIALLYGYAGTLNFSALSVIFSKSTIDPWFGYITLALIFVGFGVTASIVPFHTWLPDAHPAAPSSISAMLSGLVIKVAVYAITRSSFTIFSPSAFSYGVLFVVFAIITATVANIMALLQRDLKRLLAFSSTVNIGFIIFGLGVAAYSLRLWSMTGAEPALVAGMMGIVGALLHVLSHAVGKGLLFLAAGSFITKAKTRNIYDLEGVGRAMPWAGASFSIGLLSLSGAPPLAGFVSKFVLLMAGYSVGDLFMNVATSLMLVNSVFAAAYYLRLLQICVIRQKGERTKGLSEVSPIVVAPLVILMVVLIVIGCYPWPIIDAAQKAAISLFRLP